jgi:hypothetical protein
VNQFEEEYYVIHKYTKEKRWLGDHIYYLREEGHPFTFLYRYPEEILSWPFPTNLKEVVSSGWITFYDVPSNYCLWMNIMTNIFEYYLPLSAGEAYESLASKNIFASAEDWEWCEADQSAANAWVMVMVDPLSSELEVGYYYTNTITGESAWTAPAKWEDLVFSWNGWIPCCYESSLDEVFW